MPLLRHTLLGYSFDIKGFICPVINSSYLQLRLICDKLEVPQVIELQRKLCHMVDIASHRLERLSDISSVMILRPGQSKYFDGAGHAFDFHRFEWFIPELISQSFSS